MKHDQLIKGWIKKFDELLFVTNPTEEKGFMWRWKPSQLKIIKDFLRSFASVVRKNTLEEVEKMIPKYQPSTIFEIERKHFMNKKDFKTNERAMGYNQALLELRTKLQEMK